MKINKTKLELFIKKYTLKKENESVKLHFNKESSTISVRAISLCKSVLSEVKMNGVPIEETIDVGLFDTNKLKKMLEVLQEDLELNIEKNENATKVTSFKIKDADTEINCMAAELSSIPKVPVIKKIPEMTFGIEMNSAFCTRFNKGKSALADVDNFTFVPKPTGEVNLVIGHSANTNSNKVKLDTILEQGKQPLTKEITFSAKILKEVLLANVDFFSDDTKKVYFRTSEQGMGKIEFETPDFISTYYFISKENN